MHCPHGYSLSVRRASDTGWRLEAHHEVVGSTGERRHHCLESQWMGQRPTAADKRSTLLRVCPDCREVR